MAKIDQVRVLSYNGEEIGMGYNSDTGLAPGTALDFDPPTSAVSQEATSDVQIISTHESLMDSIRMSASAEGHYGFASHANAKVDWSNNTGFNSTSTFVVARMILGNLVKRGQNFRIKPSAKAILDSNQPDLFAEAFGDSFVRGWFTGGEFYAVMRITSVDSSTQTNLSASLSADIEGVGAGGSFSADLSTANSRQETRSEFFVTFFQKGGAGAAQIGTTLSVEDIKQRLKDFPTAVKDNPFPYEIEVAAYDTVPIPVPTKEQRDDFLAALQDADAQKLKYLEARNTFQFAAEHPEFFDNPPHKDILLAAAQTYLTAANAAISQAVRLSKGEINPPQFLDLSKATPPIVLPAITLARKVPAVPDPIDKKFQSLGGDQNSVLGGVVDQTPLFAPDGKGRFRRWNTGAIFWHPDVAADAFAVFANFYEAYKAFGAQTGQLGWPKSDTPVGNPMADQFFQGGTILGSPLDPHPNMQDGNVAGLFVLIPGVTFPQIG